MLLKQRISMPSKLEVQDFKIYLLVLMRDKGQHINRHLFLRTVIVTINQTRQLIFSASDDSTW